MPRRDRPLLSAVAALALAAPAAAQTSPESEVTFTVHGDSFSLPAPEGYCLPTGQQADIASNLHSWDSVNLTPVDLQRCGTFGTDDIIVKSPRVVDRMAMTRSDFITLMKGQFTTEVFNEGIALGKGDVARGSQDKITVGESEFAFRGADETCVYLAGTMQLQSGSATRLTRIGSCVTLVGDHLMTVAAYDFRPDGVDLAALMARSRDVAASITAP